MSNLICLDHCKYQLNCLYRDSPKPATNEHIELVKEVCPHLTQVLDSTHFIKNSMRNN